LDTGGALATPCGARALRAYDAVPPNPDIGVRAARPGRRLAHAVPRAAPGEERPAQDGQLTHDEASRLKDETARLKDDLVRLGEETGRLRVETLRLMDQLARHDASDGVGAGAKTGAKTGAATGGPRGADDGTSIAKPDARPDAKSNAKLDPGADTAALAPKGDLLVPEPRQSEIRKLAPEPKSEAPLADQRELQRQRTMVERAWSQLLDLAARMTKDLSSKGE
ncbi:MAG: hypothetical protein P4M07_14555, partial [Xanthobacteraceae bacterium]|nr:hypothetical protein [Xanthobacteraceae bacterium]